MELVQNILKGIVIGIANIIPGVSGGTMAVSMGIYDKIIHAVTHLLKEFWQSVKTLLPYGIGMVLGLLVFARGIAYLFAHIPLQTALLFIGLIFGGLPAILTRVKGKKTGGVGIGLFLLFFALIPVLQLLGGEETAGALTGGVGLLFILFLIGILASATMVIPGVSGSMILMSLGYYTPILNTVNDCVDALLAFDFRAMLACVRILLPFGLGVVVGIVLIAKLVEFLLKRFEGYTYCAILGLVAASPLAVFMSGIVYKVTVVGVVTGILAFGVGIVVALLLGREKKHA